MSTEHNEHYVQHNQQEPYLYNQHEPDQPQFEQPEHDQYLCTPSTPYSQYTNNELLSLLTDHNQSPEHIQASWQEFTNRFESILIKTIRFTFLHHAPKLKFTAEDVFDLVEEVFTRLAQDECHALRELVGKDINIWKDLELLVRRAALRRIGQRMFGFNRDNN
ncbi:MAG: hypothetical protein AB1489_40155 [Acidobacteriota bacterium]